jgi:phospholipid/cholesterol/gamma-HCH transport system substrate-binding protein
LKPGAVVEGTPSVDLTEAIRSVVEVLQQAASTMRRVDQLIAHADDVVLQVGGTLRRVDGAVTRVDDIILSTQNLQHVTCTFANIEASSSNAVAVTASLRALLDEGRNSVTNTLNKLSAAADNLNGTLRRVDGVVAGAEPDVRASLKNLADSTGKVNAILDKLEKSDGTVGKLMNDPALHDELLRLVRNLREHGLFYREGPSKSGGPTTEPKRGKAPVPSRPAKETGPDTKPGEPHEERP